METMEMKRLENIPNNFDCAITSYGLVTFCMVEGEPKFLLYQRRDNYEYVDLVRGNWHTEKKFGDLFISLTFEERERLRLYTFGELWKDLWVGDVRTEGYIKAEKKYNAMKHKISEYMLKGIPSKYSEPPWGFPKGRKSYGKESEVECAIREFAEETKMSIDDVYIWDIKPYQETYKGTDGKIYGTYYYLAESQYEMPIKKIKLHGSIREETVSEEAAEVVWVGFEEACRKLDIRKQLILRKVISLIKSNYKHYSPLS